MSEVPTEPGIYRDLPDELYRKIPFVSQSILKMVDRDADYGASPLHAKAAFDGKYPTDSDALRYGRAEHCWIHEGEDEFRRRTLVATSCVGTIKSRNGELCGAAAYRLSPKPQHPDDQWRQSSHMLLQSGWELREESESGSCYYVRGIEHCRVSDHAPTEATERWLNDVRGSDVRVAFGSDVLLELKPLVSETATPLKFWYCGKHSDKSNEEPTDYVSAEDVERIKAMAEGIRNHEINEHLRRTGQSEVVIIYDVPVQFYVYSCRECGADGTCRKVAQESWRCDACGESMVAPVVALKSTLLRSKVRIDRLGDPTDKFPHLISDLKRMQRGEGRRKQREWKIRDYGWDVQAAAYTEAVRLHFGVERCHYIWVFVEEKYPHDVVWFPASHDTLAVGHDKLTRYRQEWCRCVYLNKWPGYCVGNQEPGGLPDGVIREYRKCYGDNDGHLPSERIVRDGGEAGGGASDQVAVG